MLHLIADKTNLKILRDKQWLKNKKKELLKNNFELEIMIKQINIPKVKKSLVRTSLIMAVKI